MKGYLSIGKVAKIKEVSIKSLRYYDEIGIFKPAFIDPETNYRYYKDSQLYLLDAIHLCIKLGIPLINLEKYLIKDGTLDLQRLLYDGKVLAETKIQEIHSCLEQLQNTLQQISSCEGNINSISPSSNSGSADLVYDQILLTVPLEETTISRYYGQYILQLFVDAQNLGFSATYPSGVLYEIKSNNCKRYMFLHLSQENIFPNSDLISQSDWKDFLTTHPCIRKLSYRKSKDIYLKEHMELNAFPHDYHTITGKSLPRNGIILEEDVLNSEQKNAGYPIVLRILD